MSKRVGSILYTFDPTEPALRVVYEESFAGTTLVRPIAVETIVIASSVVLAQAHAKLIEIVVSEVESRIAARAAEALHIQKEAESKSAIKPKTPT